MELTYLHTFLEVAKSGSFTQTAEKLGYAQSSVTTQIQRLEESYGAVLFERFGRRMKLTHAGEVLLGYARDLIRLHGESKEAVSAQNGGSLSIGTIETMAAFFLPPHLQAFQRAYPEMNVMLQPGSEPAIIEAVRAGELDLGVILDPPFADPDFYTIAVREEPLVIVAHPEHRLSGLGEVSIGDLAGESLILTEEGCTYRAMLLGALKEAGVGCKLSYEFGNLEAIKQCVVYGLGVALLPEIVVRQDVRLGKLSAKPFAHPACRFYTQIIYAKRKWVSKPFRYFLELVGAPVGGGQESAGG
ncbi:LysR family transcriptional regulator [Paenibacillus xanthanilyticus]|uniref:LysR family transcriptional regulator n=1 Tax=Paenibacillus xanthanilyticus TaxID=1783531 RepID=A0ABV8K117_9BACL